MKRIAKTINLFIKQTIKNYNNMKQKIKKINATFIIFCIVLVTLAGCNVTRKVTTESSYYQKGDTTCTIVTKTIESYDATKKGM